MTGKIKGADKMRAALDRMATAFKGVSQAALAASEANAKLNIAATWPKMVGDYARFGMDPSKGISVSRLRESKAMPYEEAIDRALSDPSIETITIQPSRMGKMAYFEERIAELEAAGKKVTRITPEMLQRHAVKVRETYKDFVERAFGASTAQEPSSPVSREDIIENIRKAIADAVKNGLMVQPPPDDLFVRGRYQPMALSSVEKDHWYKTYLRSYPLYAPRYPSMVMNLDPGAFPSIRISLPNTPRGHKALAMWFRVPIDGRRRKRALRILKHELKLAAEARRLWS